MRNKNQRHIPKWDQIIKTLLGIFLSVKCYEHFEYEDGSESSVIGVITLIIDMINCCLIP